MTIRMKDEVPVNDAERLEQEAAVMGQRAAGVGQPGSKRIWKHLKSAVQTARDLGAVS